MNTETVKVNNFEFRVYPYKEYISEELRKNGSYEGEYIGVIQGYMKLGDIVFDIGANIGLHTVHYSHTVGPSGKVLAFEPDPSNLELLRYNVIRNKCSNVVIYPFALGASNETRKLYLCNRNRGKQSFADLDSLNNSIDVEVHEATDFPEIEGAAVVKMDVEGAEPLVLEGFGKNRPPIIFFEFTTKQLLALKHDPLEFLNRLINGGYKISIVEGQEVYSVNAKEMAKLASRTNNDYNLLAKL